MLMLKGLAKSFGDRRVLDGFDLTVASGESVALLGANGSGKTTTLRCIVGLVQPDRGAITIDGIDLTLDAIAARTRLSYLPQKSAFPVALTVREVLLMVARLRGLGGQGVDREVELCGLAPVADRGVGHLSGGERQRLALAVAFLPPVSLYLFDEPSASLDPAASRILFERARALTREGRTLLFTTHAPTDVRYLATRVALLRDGRIESEASGEFELRRYERRLERDLCGDNDETSDSRDHGDCGIGGARGLHRARATAGGGAARSH
jgi:ABC-type multidrug transport system ATPase subunit